MMHVVELTSLEIKKSDNVAIALTSNRRNQEKELDLCIFWNRAYNADNYRIQHLRTCIDDTVLTFSCIRKFANLLTN
jgi:hypothetical protein